MAGNMQLQRWFDAAAGNGLTWRYHNEHAERTQRRRRGDAERMSRELQSGIQELQIRVYQSFQGDVPRKKQDLSHQTCVY